MLRKSLKLLSLAFVFLSAVYWAGSGWSADEPKPAPEPEPEFVIAKYGSLSVKCSEPGCRVYVDDNYKGGGDSVIEGIVVGDHVISCKTDDKAVSGTFAIKKNETLRLEANFNEGKLVHLRESAKETVVEKKKPEPKKPEPKKAEPKKTEPKKAEQKNPVEERRRNHLNVMKIEYEITDSQDINIEHAGSAHAITRFNVKKSSAGKYYRTKQGILLCDAGPCELTWSATFMYVDENGKDDALLLNWKQTVFNGITPAGTSRQDMECCLNGQCWKMQENPKTDSQQFEIGRYRLVWNRSSVLIRRSDIMKEILEAGRSLSDY